MGSSYRFSYFQQKKKNNDPKFRKNLLPNDVTINFWPNYSVTVVESSAQVPKGQVIQKQVIS